jgi:pyruvate formate lyase activating enzyme
MEVGAQKISLLPYHEGGKSKSEQLGRLYQFHEGKIPDDEHVNKLKRIIKNEGLKVTVGN